MIRSISKHAKQRMQERLGVKHPIRAENKILKWGERVIADDTAVLRKGILYIVKEGELITCYRASERGITKISRQMPVLMLERSDDD